MKLQKTIRAKIFGLTATKEALLRMEYDAWQSYLRGDKTMKLYSATKQQADRMLGRLRKRYKPDKLYPMILRNDCVRIEKAKDTTWAKWWFKVPVANLKGGVWCPVELPDSQMELMGLKIKECKLIRKNGYWSVHIVVEKDVPINGLIPQCKNVVGVDLGEVRPAAAVLIADREPMKPILADKGVRELRMHYNWLRQRLGEKKCLKTIRKIGRTERRKVDAKLHKLSKEIVRLAKDGGAAIVIGDLKGIRASAAKRGKRFRAKIARMPSFRLASFIEYKAQWAGVPVMFVDEAYTSKTCHICNNIGHRRTQGSFDCPTCGSQYNADLNGAINIGRRFMDYMSKNRGPLDRPPNFGIVMPNG